MKDDDVKAMNAVAQPDFDALLRDLFLHSREISGDCAYFVDLTPAQQAELIARTEQVN